MSAITLKQKYCVSVQTVTEQIKQILTSGKHESNQQEFFLFLQLSSKYDII